LKPANKQFNNLKNDYEMTLTNDSEIAPCTEEIEAIPTLQFNFVPINSVEIKSKDDLIGKYIYYINNILFSLNFYLLLRSVYLKLSKFLYGYLITEYKQ
jgi:hypothetical protein